VKTETIQKGQLKEIGKIRIQLITKYLEYFISNKLLRKRKENKKEKIKENKKEKIKETKK